MQAGEWAGYAVEVAAAGSYTLRARAMWGGTNGALGTFHVEVDGADVTGPLRIPDSGWAPATVMKSGVRLAAGRHTLRVVADTNASNGAAGDIDYLDFALEAAAAPPPAAAAVRWVVTDHLGTPRMVIDQTGSLAGVSRHDYLPFGEEVGAGVAGRTTGRGYSQPDGVRQGFTGYEKDDETRLNYAKARYQSPTMGRFTSPDPYGPWAMSEGEKVAFLASPQQWNRYAYVINNPLRLTDPTGLEVYEPGVSDEHQARIHNALVRISKNGTDEQRRIATYILNNDVLISVISQSSTIEGGAHIVDSSAANADIANGWVSMERAASHTGIRINAFQLADTPDRTVSLEGSLVHEGRHVFGFARTISSLSAREGAEKVFDPTEFRNEYEAFMSEAYYYKKQGGVYHQVGLGKPGLYADLLRKEGDTITVNSERIRGIIRSQYGVSEQNPGPTTTEKHKLSQPRQ
ncbi:MAG: carbohydrate-binding protein [Acidobacteriota bacterium]|nr:carbohydrate-binding protein [Acidobacteriota bacterium]